jgi:hypothetical protein
LSTITDLSFVGWRLGGDGGGGKSACEKAIHYRFKLMNILNVSHALVCLRCYFCRARFFAGIDLMS